MVCVRTLLHSLRNDSATLCFIAAYDGVVGDYSLYNNKVYTSAGVYAVEDSRGATIGSDYVIHVDGGKEGILVALENSLDYGLYTVVLVVLSPSYGADGWQIGNTANYVRYRSVHSESVEFYTCFNGQRLRFYIPHLQPVVYFDKDYIQIRKDMSLVVFQHKVLVPYFNTSSLKYVHIAGMWNLDFDDLQVIENMRYYSTSSLFCYFLLYKGYCKLV